MERVMRQRYFRGFTAAEGRSLGIAGRESLRAIGRAFGKPSSSIYFQLAPHGGIRPSPRRRSIIPDVEDGLALGDVRARARKLKDQVETLKRVPIPAPNIREKVRAYVERLPLPIIGGIGAGESLTVQWQTGLHALLAFVEPDVLAERLMGEIDRIANTPCPLAQRERKIAELEGEIDRLMRIEESLVVATGAPRQPGMPASGRSGLLLDRLDGDETRLPPGLMSALEAKRTCRDGVMT
jgi:hypothetical protein